ncbi:hypothetical protein [Streptomyces sirii]
MTSSPMSPTPAPQPSPDSAPDHPTPSCTPPQRCATCRAEVAPAPSS